MNIVKYAFFLGCIMPNRYPGIELAMRNIAPTLGIELLDMKGASCCPAPGVFKSFHQPTWLALAARNLCIAEELSADVTTLCNGCYATLREANTVLKENPAKKDEVNTLLREINKEFQGKIEVKHFVEVLYKEIGVEKLGKLLKSR